MYKRCNAKKTFSESTALHLTLSLTFWVGKIDGLVPPSPPVTRSVLLMLAADGQPELGIWVSESLSGWTVTVYGPGE